jgi:hypothetical protein
MREKRIACCVLVGKCEGKNCLEVLAVVRRAVLTSVLKK